MDNTSLFNKSNIFYTVAATILLFVLTPLHLLGVFITLAGENNPTFPSFDMVLGYIGMFLWILSLFRVKMMKVTFVYLLVTNLFFYL